MSDEKGEKQIKNTLPAGMKPPWKPGQSGNPAGRPKKERAIATAMTEYLQGTIDTEQGTITRQQALVKALYGMALKGDVAAARLIVEHIESKPPALVEADIMQRDNKFLDILIDTTGKKGE